MWGWTTGMGENPTSNLYYNRGISLKHSIIHYIYICIYICIYISVYLYMYSIYVCVWDKTCFWHSADMAAGWCSIYLDFLPPHHHHTHQQQHHHHHDHHIILLLLLLMLILGIALIRLGKDGWGDGEWVWDGGWVGWQRNGVRFCNFCCGCQVA